MDEIKPKISIIVPCFNLEEHIHNFLNSLDNQTFKDYEAIFINDGSTDNTKILLENYVSKNKNGKLISLPANIGAGDARNIGIHACRGDYLLFLDGDDFFNDNLLEIAYNKAIETNVDILMYRTNVFDYLNNSIENNDINWLLTEPFHTERILTKNDIGNRLFSFCRGATWNKLFKRKLILDNNLFFLNLPRHNDSYFIFCAYIMAETFYIINERLYTYTINRPNSIQTAVPDFTADTNKCAIKYFLKRHGLFKKYGIYANEIV